VCADDPEFNLQYWEGGAGRKKGKEGGKKERRILQHVIGIILWVLALRLHPVGFTSIFLFFFF
jgi:hypothetical protein